MMRLPLGNILTLLARAMEARPSSVTFVSAIVPLDAPRHISSLLIGFGKGFGEDVNKHSGGLDEGSVYEMEEGLLVVELGMMVLLPLVE